MGVESRLSFIMSFLSLFSRSLSSTHLPRHYFDIFPRLIAFPSISIALLSVPLVPRASLFAFAVVAFRQVTIFITLIPVPPCNVFSRLPFRAVPLRVVQYGVPMFAKLIALGTQLVSLSA
jgi:hypothetical protein